MNTDFDELRRVEKIKTGSTNPHFQLFDIFNGTPTGNLVLFYKA